MNIITTLCLTKHRGWLLSTILFLLLGFCFLLLSVCKPDWLHIQCGSFQTEFGIWRICGINASWSEIAQSKECHSILMRSDLNIPHWFSSVQYMCLISVILLSITVVICSLYICAKPVDNVPLGIAGMCMSCASFLVVVTMLASNLSKDFTKAYFITITEQLFEVICKQPKFKVSNFLLLTGISTILVSLAGVWALLASCLIASGIGNIPSKGVYTRGRNTTLTMESEVNHGYTFDSDGSDEENHDTLDFEVTETKRYRRNSVIIDTALNL